MIFVWTLSLSGLLLIFFEFFLPGGIMAMGGGLLLMASLFLFYLTNPGTLPFIGYLAVLSAAIFCVVRFALWRIKASSKQGTIYLNTDQEGFQASLYPKELVGKVGVAATDLKPSGHVWIDSQSFQALSKIGYIDKGTAVKVLGGQGSHLIVNVDLEKV